MGAVRLWEARDCASRARMARQGQVDALQTNHRLATLKLYNEKLTVFDD
jgi:hypothetical protein